MDLSTSIKNERKKAGLSQKELGKKLGVSQAMIAQYENGKRTPKLSTIQKIANALNVGISRFLTAEMWSPLEKSDVYEWYETLGETRSDKINAAFKKLNSTGQDKAIEQVNLLTKIPEYQKDPDQE